jgi:hypothetical protein
MNPAYSVTEHWYWATGCLKSPHVFMCKRMVKLQKKMYRCRWRSAVNPDWLIVQQPDRHEYTNLFTSLDLPL